MTVLLPTPPTRLQPSERDPARTLDTLATVLVLILTVGILYLAREILVPIAIAVLLSFVLSPPVKALRSVGLGKAFAVGTVVCLAFAIAVGLGFELTRQITDLAADAPRYQATVARKVEFARDLIAHNALLAKVNSVAADMSKLSPPELKPEQNTAGQNQTRPKEAIPRTSSPSPARPHSGPDTTPANPLLSPATQTPVRVEVVSPPPDILTIIQTVGGAAASPLVAGAFVALFVVFILMQREDLRNRFIRLVGSGDLNRTTLAMNEAASRLSRYFLAQMLLNTGFGIVVAVALALIGVPSAILWGIVATFMRFIPYLGSAGAAFFPVVMAAAAGDGWSMAIETALLFLVMEVVTGQAIEPLVYGRNTGISPIAVVVSATFWTWLWGPVGLVLSTPLTVCLVVMGRHVERLAFLDVILGDAPPLTAAETFYQRMLVGDPSEIVDHAEDFLRERSLLDYCDTVAMKALLMAQIDVRRGALDDRRQARICDAMRDLVDDLADLDQTTTKTGQTPPLAAPVDAAEDVGTAPSDAIGDVCPHAPIPSRWTHENAVVCVAGRTPLDEAAAHILADLLTQKGIGAHVEPASSLSANTLGHLAGGQPELIILSFLDADLSVAQARFAVRRLRRHIPDVPLVAAFWMPETDETRTTGLCSEVRCDICVASLPQALKLCLDRAYAPAGTESEALASRDTASAALPVADTAPNAA